MDRARRAGPARRGHKDRSTSLRACREYQRLGAADLEPRPGIALEQPRHHHARDMSPLAGTTGGLAGGGGGGGGGGSQGPQGPQGNQGPQGPGGQGPQGAQGAAGPQGTQGLQGNQGFQGLQGSQGDVGTKAVKARKAPRGPQGTQGFQGFQGFQGNQGTQGNQGFQGDTGVGSQGAQGLQGAQGGPGTQGAQGFQGAQAASGGLAIFGDGSRRRCRPSTAPPPSSASSRTPTRPRRRLHADPRHLLGIVHAQLGHLDHHQRLPHLLPGHVHQQRDDPVERQRRGQRHGQRRRRPGAARRQRLGTVNTSATSARRAEPGCATGSRTAGRARRRNALGGSGGHGGGGVDRDRRAAERAARSTRHAVGPAVRALRCRWPDDHRRAAVPRWSVWRAQAAAEAVATAPTAAAGAAAAAGSSSSSAKAFAGTGYDHGHGRHGGNGFGTGNTGGGGGGGGGVRRRHLGFGRLGSPNAISGQTITAAGGTHGTSNGSGRRDRSPTAPGHRHPDPELVEEEQLHQSLAGVLLGRVDQPGIPEHEAVVEARHGLDVIPRGAIGPLRRVLHGGVAAVPAP